MFLCLFFFVCDISKKGQRVIKDTNMLIRLSVQPQPTSETKNTQTHTQKKKHQTFAY